MRLKELRIKKNLKQEDVAKALSMSQTGYSYYESGRSEPNIETLCKLANYYNVSIDYLIGRENKNDVGYLTPQQVECVSMIKQLNETNLIKAMGYLSAMISMQ